MTDHWDEVGTFIASPEPVSESAHDCSRAIPGANVTNGDHN